MSTAADTGWTVQRHAAQVRPRHPRVLGRSRGAVALAFLLLTGCTVEEEADEGTTGAEARVAAAELVAEPADCAGQAVVVEAVVEETLTPHAFTITADGAPPPREDALVVVWPNAPVTAGDSVVVDGVVRDSLQVEELEEQFGSEWTDPVRQEHGGRPWVEAAVVEVAEP